MLTQQLIENLHTLRMKYMAKGVHEFLNDPAMQSLDCIDQLNFIVDKEIHGRENNKQNLLLKQAKLRVNACPEDIDYQYPRGLDKKVMQYLITCQFIDRKQHVIFTAPTGLGKTWLSSALGQAAVRKKYSVFSIRMAQLFEEFQIAHADGSLPKYRKKLAKPKLLIIDDWSLATVTTRARQELFELIESRDENGSIIITSQLPIEEWHSFLGEATISDAILDRVVSRAHRIELHGDSMRKVDLTLPNDQEVK